jgi:hypothetical protein
MLREISTHLKCEAGTGVGDIALLKATVAALLDRIERLEQEASGPTNLDPKMFRLRAIAHALANVHMSDGDELGYLANEFLEALPQSERNLPSLEVEWGEVERWRKHGNKIFREAATRKGAAENNNGFQERTERQPEGATGGRAEQGDPGCTGRNRPIC